MANLTEIVNRLPDPDERGMLTKIDKSVVDGVTREIHRGGRDALLALIDLLREPGRGDDVKPHYALHCLAIHLGGLDDDAPRRAFAETLASQLGGSRPKAVQSYLIEQLQVAGGPEVAPALGRCLTDEDLVQPAASALFAIRRGAAQQFRGALPKTKGRARDIIQQNLKLL